jgi:opacity protein-like surface antigen
MTTAGLSTSHAQSTDGVPASGFYAGVGVGVSANLVVPINLTSGRRSNQSQAAEREHDFAFVPHAGYTFDRSYIYAGAGPSLTRTQVKLNDVEGFANINGAAGTSVTGAPTSYSSSQWLIGATLTAGATYFLTPSWSSTSATRSPSPTSGTPPTPRLSPTPRAASTRRAS